MDDTDLLVDDSFWPDLKTLVDGVLVSTGDWFAENNNANKNNIMFFQTSNSADSCKYKIAQSTQF